MTTESVTLDELLASREERWHKQKELVESHPDQTLICLTVMLPGSVKRNTSSLVVAQAAVQALKTAFNTEKVLEFDLNTGYEAYLFTPLLVEEAKRVTCHIEETHPLGRLFDIDVIDRDVKPVSRDVIGMPPRKCLLCQQDARFCMRNHTHTQEELNEHIIQLVDEYVHRL